ncbi:MAG: MATE family efflux transporter [bacterium]|nr:MATE family efflux transporter [bacterium]
MRAAVRVEFPRLVTIAIPLALAQLAQNGMGLIDTLMAGRLGAESLAGIALGSVTFFVVTIVMSSMLYAVGPMVAQATGARRPDDAVRALRQGLWWSVLLTPPAMGLLAFVPAALRLMGQDPAVVDQAGGYLRAVSFGVLPLMAFTALRAYLEGQGRTRPLMLVAFLGVGLNVVANQAFMFGRWGFPALGLTGTGVATSIVYALMALAGFAYVARRDVVRRVFARPWRWEAPVAREILRLGWPIAVTVGFETGLFAISALLMGLIGPAELAGHQVAIQTASFSFMIPLALGVATTARVGHAVGRGDPMGVRAAGAVGMVASVMVMSLTALLYWLAPRAVVGLYLDVADPANAAVVWHAASFLALAALFQLADGLQVSALGALRGLKDTRAPMLITLLSYWAVGLSSGVWLAFGRGLGGVGLWWGLVLGLTVASVALTARFLALLRRVPAVSRPGVDSPA